MIHISNLTYTYPGTENKAIKDLTFSINKGEIFGFLGPSGAGKSTTQKVLIGLLKDFTGKVEVMGKNIQEFDQSYYENIGVSFEFPNHFLKLTGLENLRYFASFYEKKIPVSYLESILDKVGLLQDKDQIVRNYSKGMKNRLNVARSIIHSPQILFLDEPTAGLDPVNTEKIMSIIKEKQAEGVTIFISSHNMEVIDRICNRVAFIHDGEIKIIGTPHKLKLQHGNKTVKIEYGNDKLRSKEFDIENLGSNSDFITLLKENTIKTIHSQEATLAAVFIAITGRSLQ